MSSPGSVVMVQSAELCPDDASSMPLGARLVYLSICDPALYIEDQCSLSFQKQAYLFSLGRSNFINTQLAKKGGDP